MKTSFDIPNDDNQTNGLEILEVAPKFHQLTSQVLYGEIWEGKLLSKRERSLITLASISSLSRVEQLPHHIELAKKHGIEHKELVELATHIAFYAGWPATVSLLTRLTDATQDKQLDKEQAQ